MDCVGKVILGTSILASSSFPIIKQSEPPPYRHPSSFILILHGILLYTTTQLPKPPYLKPIRGHFKEGQIGLDREEIVTNSWYLSPMMARKRFTYPLAAIFQAILDQYY